MLREALQTMSGRENVIRSLVQMDEPDHMKYRVLTQAWFSRSNLKNIEIEVARLATDYVDRLVKHKDQCDFVKQVAIPFPLRVIMSILGVPRRRGLHAEAYSGAADPDDPDNHRSFDSTELMDVVRDFEQYFDALAKKRRSNPTDDLATAIANGKINDGPMPDLETYGYYIIVATAGHETTAAAISGALLALIENPDQLERLRSDIDSNIDGFVEESLRWVSPVRHFVRTAVQDYVLDGRLISENESVALWYPSGIRDENIFTESQKFDISRSPNKHVSFGHGAHLCLGQHLARMEIRSHLRSCLHAWMTYD